MTHREPISGVRRSANHAARVLAVALAGVAGLAGPATAQAAGQVSASGWTQYQGGAAHMGAVATGPAAPYAVDHITTFDDLPGGSSATLGLSAPVVSGQTAVVVGPTSVRAVSLGDGGMEWSVPRTFGPSVPAAIYEPTAAVACARCHPVVVYTEGWGTGPGNPTSSATPTTSVRPGALTSPSSSGSTSPPTTPPASTGTASPSGTVPLSTPIPTDLMARSLIDGSKEWNAPVQLKATSRTGVTVDGSTAFVGDIRGNVYAVDLASGKLTWSVNVGGSLESTLAVADGQVLVSVSGYSSANAKLVALSETTGAEVWHYDAGHPGFITSPAIAGGRAFIGITSGGTVGLVSSLVSVDLANGPRVHLAQWGSPLFAPVTFATAPVIAGDRVIIEDSSGNVYAVNRSTTTGNADWTFATNLTFARGAPVVIGGQVLVPTDNGILLALDVVSGHEVFQSAYAGGQLHYPAPVGTDRVIFTRGGPRPGLVTFINDPNGAALTDIVSPTAANYGKILGDFAIAAAAILLLALLLFRPMARRMGPAFFIEDGEATQAAVEDQG